MRTRAPHIVVSDVNMPRMDGIALVRSIRSHDPRIACVLTTAFMASEQLAFTTVPGTPVIPKERLVEDLVPFLQRAVDALQGAPRASS